MTFFSKKLSDDMKHLLATLLFLAAFAVQAAAAIWYVKTNGNDNNTGATWATAFQNVQRAVDMASSGDEIWVAAGTYLPNTTRAGSNPRDKVFYIWQEVKLFGGFPAAGGQWNQRDWAANPTILSGDLGVQGSTSDNAYHVVYIDNRSTDTWLDGFTVKNGHANGSWPENKGGGIYNHADFAGASTPTIQHCKILNNSAEVFGGGLYNDGSENGYVPLVMTDCTFSGNSALLGGGMYNDGSQGGTASSVLTDCVFSSNTATYGGAMYNLSDNNGYASPVLTGCTFSANAAITNAPDDRTGGGAVFNDAGLSAQSSPSFTNCTFSNNSASGYKGGAIYSESFSGEASPSLVKCTFSGNTAAKGGCLYAVASEQGVASPGGSDCTFSGNTATLGGVAFSLTNTASAISMIFSNSLFFNNTAAERGGVLAYEDAHVGSPSFYNCTFYNNTAPQGGVIGLVSWNNGHKSAKLWNCITWGNTSTFSQTAAGLGSLDIDYSLIQEAACPTGGACATGVIYNQDPRFVNAAAHNLHLMNTSPAKNTANAYAPPFDFDGDARPQGPATDMGYDEILFACPPGPIVFVDKDATTGTDNGTSWANAYVHLQDALDAAAFCPGNVQEIWVAEGTYLPTTPHNGATDRHQTFFIASDVKIFGGFSGSETMSSQRNWNTHPTILSGDIGAVNDISDNAYHVVWIEGCNSTMELDGFTITKGKLHFNAAVANAGAGIYNNAANHNSTPTIRNCIITGNEGATNTIGAGMYNHGHFHDASPTMVDCTFSNNTAPGNSNGGAMYNYASGTGGNASPVLTNCAFTNNYAAFRGGGIYSQSESDGICAPVLTNCTFTSNSTTYQSGGSIYHVGQTLTLNNCTFTNNTAFIAGAVGVLAGAIIATDCTFSGNAAPANSGAVTIYSGSVTSIFTRCTFSNNSTPEKGGAVSVFSPSAASFEVRFERSTFSNNSAANGGALYTYGSDNSELYITLVNCQLFGNTATGRGGAICSDRCYLGRTTCYQCTFYNNTAPAGGGGAMGTLDWRPAQIPIPIWINCIAWNNSSTFGQTSGGQGSLGMAFCLIQEAACPTGANCGNGMIYNKNPLFVNAPANDVHLLACSPAVNTASGDYSSPIDFDGIARPQNGGYEMGAFEYVGAPCVLEAKCKNISINLSAAGSISVPASSIDNNSTGCNVQLLINNQTTQTYTCSTLGDNVATLKVTDCNNITSTCTATVTVIDNLPPTIACPNSQIYNTTQCNLIATYSTPTYTDNCMANVMLVSGLPSGSAFSQGVTTNLWKATDAGGNTATCSFNIAITGGQPMTLSCPANIVNNTDPTQCSALAAYTQPTVQNPCGNVTISLLNGLPSNSVFPKGTTMVSWKATSTNGTTTTCSFTVTVTDTEPPVANCPANTIRSTDANLCSAVVTYASATAADNCPGATVAYVSGGTSGSTFLKGITTVVWKATDSANLTATCSFTVTVNDTQAPTIACPANIVRGTDPNLCSAVVAYTTPAFSDNCPGVTAMHTSGGTSGSAFPKGQTTVIWIATDAANLTKTCSFKITVNDTENPVITCPANQSKNADAGLCTATTTYPTPTATDNCMPAPTLVRVSGPLSGSTFPAGVTTCVWRAIDGANRSSTCSFTVTVTDTQLPGINCPPNQSVTAAPGQCSATIYYSNPTATDNCGVNSVHLLDGLASGSLFGQGSTVNTWRAVDVNGLNQTCSFSVTVACGTGAQGGEAANRAVQGFTTSEKSPGLDLRLSPNPAVSEVQIWIENLGDAGGQLTVFDARGRMVWQTNWIAKGQLQTIDLGDFAAGLYFVTLRSEGQTVTKRLVVSRL